MRECEGKKVYPNKPQADTAAKWTRRLRESPHAAFHCAHCHGWRVGSKIREAALGRK